MNQGHNSELSVCPSKYPTADLQELCNHYLCMSQGGGKITAAFFDSVSVAGALHTIVQDLFKSGLSCVHRWTEGLPLSLLLLHLWPGKVTSVSKSTAQTWFDKYQDRGDGGAGGCCIYI